MQIVGPAAHVRQPVTGGLCLGRRVETPAVIGDGQPGGRPDAFQHDFHLRGARVPGNVGQSFLGRQEQGPRDGRRQRLYRFRRGRKVGRNRRIHLKLALQPGQCLGQIARETLRPKIQDEVANVTDGVIQPFDRLQQQLVRLLRIVGQRQARRLQREAHGVDRLDDAVVQVHADAGPLFQDRQPADLLVEPRVADGDGRVDGQHLHQRLIFGREGPRAGVVGQVEIAHRHAAGDDRQAQKGDHLRMPFRKAGRTRIVGQAFQPDEPVFADDGPQQAIAPRPVGNARRLLRRDAADHERFQHAVGPGHAQGGVLRARQLPGRVDDLLQDFVERQFGGDGGRRPVVDRQPPVIRLYRSGHRASRRSWRMAKAAASARLATPSLERTLLT